METLFTIVLVLHIAGGTVALLAAPVAMITHKGGNKHRLAGKLFYWGMTVIFVSAIFMSIYHHIPFLLMVSFFAFQMATSGYQALRYKKLHEGQRVKTFDWVILTIAGLFNVLLFGWGIYELIALNNLFGMVALIFAVIGFGYAWRDWKAFRNKYADENSWLYRHISGMMGGYIAAVTAFLVVNFNSLPFYITWLGPAIVGTPILTWFINSYRKKTDEEKKVQELSRL